MAKRSAGLIMYRWRKTQVGNTSTEADWLETISLFLGVRADRFFLYDFEQYMLQVAKA
jgi:hypothetical protein